MVIPTPALMAMVVWWSFPFCTEPVPAGHELGFGCRIATVVGCLEAMRVSTDGGMTYSGGPADHKRPLTLIAYAYYAAAYEVAFGPGWTLYAQQEANGMHSIKVRSYEN